MRLAATIVTLDCVLQQSSVATETTETPEATRSQHTLQFLSVKSLCCVMYSGFSLELMR